MRTFLCMVIFGLLNEADMQGYITLDFRWIFILAFGTALVIIKDIAEIAVLLKTKTQLDEIVNQIKKL